MRRLSPSSPLAAALALAGAALLSTAAQARGDVEVVFVHPEQYADAGRGPVAIERTTQTLAAHFGRLGERLPDGQRLRVEVLDVDLAGELRPFAHRDDLRVLRGGADWPSMRLRYTLTGTGGAPIASGEERLTDMNYLWTLRGHRAEEPLAHDRRMIDHWFAERFEGARTAAR